MRLFSSPAPRWAIVAVALWTVAPILVVFGGWPGLIAAVVFGGYGSHLLHKRRQLLAPATPVAAAVSPAAPNTAVASPAATPRTAAA